MTQRLFNHALSAVLSLVLATAFLAPTLSMEPPLGPPTGDPPAGDPPADDPTPSSPVIEMVGDNGEMIVYIDQGSGLVTIVWSDGMMLEIQGQFVDAYIDLGGMGWIDASNWVMYIYWDEYPEPPTAYPLDPLT